MPKDYKLSPQVEKVYARLKEVRASKTVSLKPTSMLREEIKGLSGEIEPFKLRYYQVQGAFHLLLLKRMVLGDDMGLGKTIQILTALCYLWEKEPQDKVIVLAPKSAIRQWASEIQRFTKGVRTIVVSKPKTTKAGGALEARKAAYKAWAEAPTGPDDPKVVLILNYALLVRDWNIEGFRPLKPNGRPDPKQPVVPGVLDARTQEVAKAGNLIVVFDEATAFKSMRTKTWEMSRFLADRAQRVYGLTGTLLKNHLMEGYCIYKVIKPDLFTTKTQFYEDYCYVEMQKVGKHKIPIVKGYKNLEHFRGRIDPFYIGRKKHMVSDELPQLITREVTCELSEFEDSKYEEALSGVLQLGNGEIRDFEEHKALTSLIYCQQVANSLALLKFEGSSTIASLSAKEEGLLDLLSEELSEEKVIVYTRFESHIARLQAILKKSGIKSVRITGKEDDDARQKAQELFQDVNSDVKVVFVTSAGREAINLQAAAALIFFDLPWSWGDYLQILGRMVRIGSPHKGVLAFHLMAKRPQTAEENQTIDQHVLQLLRRKKNPIEKILGESAVGALKFDKEGISPSDLIRAMQRRESV